MTHKITMLQAAPNTKRVQRVEQSFTSWQIPLISSEPRLDPNNELDLNTSYEWIVWTNGPDVGMRKQSKMHTRRSENGSIVFVFQISFIFVQASFRMSLYSYNGHFFTQIFFGRNTRFEGNRAKIKETWAQLTILFLKYLRHPCLRKESTCLVRRIFWGDGSPPKIRSTLTPLCH